MHLPQWIIFTVCLYLAKGQVLNGYINPLWMSDRRSRERSLYSSQQSTMPISSDYYMNRGGLYRDRPDLRSMSDLFYMDDVGRYHPVYRSDGIFRTDRRSPAERSQQEYFALPANSESFLQT